MRLWRDRRGGTSTEYIILLLILLMTGFLAYQYLGKSTSRSTHAAGASLNGESPTAAAGGGGSGSGKGSGSGSGGSTSKKSGHEGDESRSSGGSSASGGGGSAKKPTTGTSSPDNAGPTERSRGKSHSFTQGWFFKIFVAGMIFAGLLAAIFGAKKNKGAAAK
jgi:hypothetical protein